MSDFDRFLRQFEVLPPTCPPALPTCPQPSRRLRLISILDAARFLVARVGRVLVLAFAIAFWSIAATAVATALVLGVLEAMR